LLIRNTIELINKYASEIIIIDLKIARNKGMKIKIWIKLIEFLFLKKLKKNYIFMLKKIDIFILLKKKRIFLIIAKNFFFLGVN
jgi:hypothetical protein